MLSVLAFFQASLVLAACAMDRGGLAQVLVASTPHECCDETMGDSLDAVAPMSTNTCVAHTTADLQVVATPPVICAPALLAPLLVPPAHLAKAVHRPSTPQAAQIPPRILLHSFLI